MQEKCVGFHLQSCTFDLDIDFQEIDFIFQEDPMLINELRDDVREESSKFGEVKNVKLYDVGVNFCV